MTTVGMSLPSAQGCNVPVVYFQRQDGRTTAAMRSRVSPEVRAKAIAMRQDGARMPEICQALQIADGTARSILAGVQPRRRSKFRDRITDAPAWFKAEMAAARRSIRGYAQTLTRCPERAEDLVQDAMVKALVEWEGFEQGTNMVAWLLVLMRNHYRTEARSRNNQTVEDPDDVMAKAIVVPGRQESHLDLATVMSGIDRLPVPQAKALRLAVFEDLTYEQIAVVLGCEPGTIKSRVKRAREGLLLELEGRPIRPQPESHHVE
jgi:RNA polymerase sigma-70 factor (ECF subfamily)